MKYIIPIIILSFVLLSCSKDEDEETQTAAEKAAAAQLVALEGTWKTACSADSDNTSWIDTLTVAGNVVTGKWEKHSGTSCATDYSLEETPLTISIGDAVTFANGKTGHKFTVTLGSTVKITPQSASAVSAFNTSSKCGYNKWALDTAKVCEIDEDDAGETAYGLYQLDGNKWYAEVDDEYPDKSDVDTSDAENTFTKQ